MGTGESLNVWIGYDSREAITSDVASFSIRKRTKSPTHIQYLKHRDLRKSGHFTRSWVTIGATGDWIDTTDGKPFSTEFSHTRFLIPALMKYKGWALFMDSDMVFMSDIAKLFAMTDDSKAAMVVKHSHHVRDSLKMDGRAQLAYHRKNWSSFVLWNCEHPLNRQLTADRVNSMKGTDLHAFNWLPDSAIGTLPFSYNYISGVSPPISSIKGPGNVPDVIHYTEGGPWFENCREVPYADLWLSEYDSYQRSGGIVISDVPTIARDGVEVRRK